MLAVEIRQDLADVLRGLLALAPGKNGQAGGEALRAAGLDLDLLLGEVALDQGKQAVELQGLLRGVGRISLERVEIFDDLGLRFLETAQIGFIPRDQEPAPAAFHFHEVPLGALLDLHDLMSMRDPVRREDEGPRAAVADEADDAQHEKDEAEPNEDLPPDREPVRSWGGKRHSFFKWRRRWDSNPRSLAALRFSRPAH